ncbi:MAG: hypothetical protein ACI3ZL_09340 [Candidatus Cryptobacteroides sp.]
MKTKSIMQLKSIIYGTIALVSLSACSKVEQREMGPVPVNWQVIQDSQSTKASAYSTGDTFLAWAWYLPDGQTWSSNKASAMRFIGDEHGSTIGYVSSANAWKNVIWDGSAWNEGVSYYWPKAGALSFFATSPSSLGSAVTCTTGGIEITGWDVDAHQDIDVMVADLVTDQRANTSSVSTWLNGVPTVFRHKLTKVVGFSFNLHKDYSNGHDGSYVSGDIRYFLKSVKILNVPQTGDFAVSSPAAGSSGAWTPQGSATGSYTWYSNDSGLEIKYGSTATPVAANSLDGTRDYIYLMPQTFTDPGESPDWDTTPCMELNYVKRTYTSATTYSDEPVTARSSLYDILSASNHRLVVNRAINFVITFNNESNIIIWAPDQSEWTGGDFEIYV